MLLLGILFVVHSWWLLTLHLRHKENQFLAHEHYNRIERLLSGEPRRDIPRIVGYKDAFDGQAIGELAVTLVLIVLCYLAWTAKPLVLPCLQL